MKLLTLTFAFLFSFAALANFSCVDQDGIELLSINYETNTVRFALEMGDFQEATITKIRNDNDTYQSFIALEAYSEVPSSITTYQIHIDLWDGIVDITGEEEEDGEIDPISFGCFEAL